MRRWMDECCLLVLGDNNNASEMHHDHLLSDTNLNDSVLSACSNYLQISGIRACGGLCSRNSGLSRNVNRNVCMSLTRMWMEIYLPVILLTGESLSTYGMAHVTSSVNSCSLTDMTIVYKDSVYYCITLWSINHYQNMLYKHKSGGE